MVNDKYFLITTSKKFFNNSKKKKIFLSSWCKLFYKENEYKNKKNILISHPWQNKKKKFQDFKYLTKKYNYFLKEIKIFLNNYHKKNYSKDYWEQILGMWLYMFLINIYEKFIIIEKFNFTKKITTQEPIIKKHIVGNNYISARNLYQSHYWNHLISIYLLKKLKKNVKIKSIKLKDFNKKFSNSILEKKIKINSFKLRLIKFFAYFFSLFKQKSKIFVINTYLGFFLEIILQFRLNKSFFFNQSFSNDYIFINKIQKKIREGQLIQKQSDDKFTKIIKEIIIKNIPLAYLEEYKNICKYTNNFKWPDLPQKIFTASNNISDDIFKIWLANKKKDGSKFIFMQHGSMFLKNFSSLDFYLKNTSDKILSWGKNYGLLNNKIHPLFNFKSTNKRFQTINQNFITLIQEMPTLYTDTLTSGMDFYDYENYLMFQDKFLKNINRENYNRIKIRFGSTDHRNSITNLIQYEKVKWFQLHPKLKYENRSEELHNDLKNSYLAIITTISSTVFLECVSSNFPFILLISDYEKIINKKFIKDFKNLEYGGVIYKNPNKLANFLNSNKPEQIVSWWNSKKNQILIHNFQKKYSNISDAPIKDIKKMLFKNDKI